MKKLMFVVALVATITSSSYATMLKSGDSIAFLGDSITQQGWEPGGYVRMCEAAFKANGLDIKIVPAGISGHKSNDMLSRLDRDVIKHKPTYMTLSCGVNDVWHQGWRNNEYKGGGVLLPDYIKNITAIVDKAEAADIKVIIFTSTMIGEDANNATNKRLASYNDFLRELAKKRGLILVDLYAEMERQVADFQAKTKNKHNYLTCDGVHMAFLGARMMAKTALKEGFKFSNEELEKSEKAIAEMPAYVHVKVSKVKLTGADYLKLADKAISENKATVQYVTPIIKEAAQKRADELHTELSK